MSKALPHARLPLALLLLALALASVKGAAPLSVTDDTGTELRLSRAPGRIISLTPAATECLFALGLEREIVGVTRYCDYPAAAKAKDKVGDLNLDYEKIIALRPDLLVAVGDLPAQSRQRLRALDLPLLAFSPTDLALTMKVLDKLGRATTRRSAAAAVVNDMQRRIRLVANRLKGVQKRPRIFVEIWMDPVMTAGPGTFTAELIDLAGGQDIAHDAKPWSPFSQELVVARDPEIIISQCASASQIRSRSGWEQIEAVRRGRVHDVDPNIFSRPGPRLVEALETLARLVHPERF